MFSRGQTARRVVSSLRFDTGKQGSRHLSLAYVQTIVCYVLTVALLCLPAVWNGFPLMYDDVGGYLERWPTGSLGLGRSAVYGLLLWVSRRCYFVPVVILQALVTSFVVDRALRIFLGSRSGWMLPIVMLGVAVTSGAAFFVSKAIPDAWEAPAVLALHLLVWHSNSLTAFELFAMSGIVSVAGASHMAILGVISGLSVLNLLAFQARRKLSIRPTGIVIASVAAGSGIVLLLFVDVVVAGRFALTPGGEALLLGRLVKEGTANEVLSEECPRGDWQLCAYKDELPPYSEAFLWDSSSPLQKIGGLDDERTQREVRSIIVRSLLDHPIEHFRRAIELTAQQFVDVGTGFVMEPVMSWHARWVLDRYAPWVIGAHDSAQQQTQSIDLSLWSDYIVVPVSIGSSLALPFLAVWLWRRNCRHQAALVVAVLCALIGNAAICGVMVGSSDRYQARLVWLATLALVLALMPTRNEETAPDVCDDSKCEDLTERKCGRQYLD